LKREQITYPIVKSFKPILWRKCRFCKLEFRKENGYKIEELVAVNANTHPHVISYSCGTCCKDINEVREKTIEERNWRPKDKIIKDDRMKVREELLSDDYDFSTYK
jgi:hypothetical protein